MVPKRRKNRRPRPAEPPPGPFGSQVSVQPSRPALETGTPVAEPGAAKPGVSRKKRKLRGRDPKDGLLANASILRLVTMTSCAIAMPREATSDPAKPGVSRKKRKIRGLPSTPAPSAPAPSAPSPPSAPVPPVPPGADLTAARELVAEMTIRGRDACEAPGVPWGRRVMWGETFPTLEATG
eukprot:Skav231441  [mRNA]  locus=scaffold1847:247969:253336:+ [translate_table: standard]